MKSGNTESVNQSVKSGSTQSVNQPVKSGNSQSVNQSVKSRNTQLVNQQVKTGSTQSVSQSVKKCDSTQTAKFDGIQSDMPNVIPIKENPAQSDPTYKSTECHGAATENHKVSAYRKQTMNPPTKHGSFCSKVHK